VEREAPHRLSTPPPPKNGRFRDTTEAAPSSGTLGPPSTARGKIRRGVNGPAGNGTFGRYPCCGGRHYHHCCGDTARVNAIDGDEVDPLFGAIEARVDPLFGARHAAALGQLDALTRTERLVFILTPLVFAIGLALVGLIWGYLRQYQRRIVDATSREIARLVEVNGTLANQAAELNAINEELRRKNEENEAFVYSVSHDLRSPLVNLQGFSQELALTGAELRTLLADPGVPPGVRARGLTMLDDDIAPALGFIQTGVRRLSGIIDALLRLSRVGEVVYRLAPVDPTPIVARIVASLNETVGGPRATVMVGALPPWCGDPSAVEQIFGNLIGNALKYLDPQRPGRIEVDCLTEEDTGAGTSPTSVRTYYVRDNGLGISAHALDKVFQPFQRLHPQVAAGDGLGLTFVRRVVERFEGRLRVESTQGAGSTFYVALPTAPAVVAAPAPVAAGRVAYATSGNARP
jgi:signal transduction histidine kinase